MQLITLARNSRSHPISPPGWQSITTERSGASSKQSFFITGNGNQFNRRMMFERITDICKRAGVKKRTIHRFRHTFAINYLRNGGNVYALQRILGHSAFEMAKRYLSIAQADITKDHQEACPIAN